MSPEITGEVAGPSDLEATTYSTTRIDLTWTNNQEDYDKICIEKQLPNEGWAEHARISGSFENYSVTGLGVGSRYYFRIRAYMGGSIYSIYCGPVDQATTLPAPTSFNAVKDPTWPFRVVNLSWSSPYSNYYSQIRIERHDIYVPTFEQIYVENNAYMEDWSDSSGLPAHTYVYRIRAYRGAPHYVYSAYTSEKSVTLESIDEPSGLSGGPGGMSPPKINLSWTNHENYDGIVLEHKRYDPDDPAWTPLEISGHPTEYEFLQCQQGCRYKFRIRGWFDYSGSRSYSGYSNEVSTYTTLAPPDSLSSTQKHEYGRPVVVLTWKQTYLGPYRSDDDVVKIERRVNGGSWVIINYVVGFDNCSYVDNTVIEGSKYEYDIQNARGVYDPICSEWSPTTEQIVGFPSPSNLTGSCTSPTSIVLTWQDNSENESGFKIYRDDVLVQTLGPNVEMWTDTGVSPSQWYTYYVIAYNALTESAPSNTLRIYTAYTPNAPSNLSAITASISQINLSWQDNSAYEVDFHIEESTNGVDFTEIATVAANVTVYERTGRSSDTLYYHRVRAHNSAGYSAYSNISSARTFANVGKPSGVSATAYSGSIVELVWNDNSTEEDGHKIERKLSGGSWAEVATIAANHAYFRNTELTSGATYIYRIRAYQGTQYSDYSDEVTVTTMTVPAMPTGLAIASKTNATQKLTWNAASGAARYYIQKSTNGSDFSSISYVHSDTLYFTARYLNANTHYWYRIYAYNPAGISSYSSIVDGYTDAEYIPTSFEKLIRLPNFTPVLLAEGNLKKPIVGFSLVSGKTYTYQHTTPERGIAIERVWENGAEYTKKTSQADVESNASSFYFDFYGRKLYIHTSGGNAPVNYFIEGSFWIYLTNYQDGTITYNDHSYLPFLKLGDIPDVSHEIRPVYKDDFSNSYGQISIMNRESKSEGYYWDKKYSDYIWENRPFYLKLGAPGFAYSEFKPIFAGNIDQVVCKDTGLTLALIDARESIHRTLPVNKLWKTNFPSMDDSLNGTPIPVLWGAKSNCFMYCVDANRKWYKFHDGRIHVVTAVKKNDVALIEGTDYYTNLMYGMITFDKSFPVSSSDKLTIDFEGIEDSANILLENGAEIFWDIAKKYWGLSADELNLDSIYTTQNVQAKELAVYIYRETSTSDIVRNLEHSLQANSFQDEEGRIGFMFHSSSIPNDVRYVENYHFFNFSMTRDRDSLVKTIAIHYNEDPISQAWSVVKRVDNQIGWKYRNDKTLEIFTYLTTESDASSLAVLIQAHLNKELVTFEVPPILYGLFPGNKFYLTRYRYFNSYGLAGSKLMRILKIDMKLSASRTGVVAEQV